MGPRALEEWLFLLPRRFDDCRKPVEDFGALVVDQPTMLRAQLLSQEQKSSAPGKPPRLLVRLRDCTGNEIAGTAFGGLWQHGEHLCIGTTVLMRATMTRWQDTLSLRIERFVDRRFADRIVPVYPGRASLPAETVRSTIAAGFAAARDAAHRRIAAIAARSGVPPEALLPAGWTWPQVLMQAHWPTSLEHATTAEKSLMRVAAAAALAAAAENMPGPNTRPVNLATTTSRGAALPMMLTSSQNVAIQDISRAMCAPTVMRRMLVADVGHGKTAVYAVVAAAMLDAGGRVLVLVPSLVLADQVTMEIQGWWRDVRATKVTSSDRATDAQRARLVVGTTAVLTRRLGEFDVVIIDEAHRFSRAQREHYVRPHTHLLEVTATCLPRSMALAQFGAMQTTVMRDGHATKKITTRVIQTDRRRDVTQRILAAVHRGEQVLVIYPKKRADEPANFSRDVASSAKKWEALLPGRVRSLSGDDLDTRKRAVIDDMREGRADLLVATTVVSEGINLPKLRHALVLDPEVFALTMLHQIRGRLARLGGVGTMLLMVSPDRTPEQIARLQLLEQIDDGWRLAEADLASRGFGDLDADSREQSGFGSSAVFGRPLTMAAVDQVLALCPKLRVETPPQ